MKKYILFIGSIGGFLSTQAQEINWLSPEEAFKMQKENPKPIFMDVYTDWCGWCKRMDKGAFKDPQIVNYLNAHFYAVKFNAETHDTLTIDDKEYLGAPKGQRGQHSFARSFGVKGYPSVFFIDKNGGNRTMGNYFEANQLAPILIFFKEELHGISDVNKFSEDFKTTFETTLPDSVKTNTINWTDINTGLKRSKKEGKKLWIQTYDRDCISCVVQDSTVYTNAFLTNYINDNYIPVKFDAFSNETVQLGNNSLVNNPADGPYHQLMIAALKGQKIQSPSVFIFNEKHELVAPVRSNLNVKYAEALMVYVNEERNLKGEDFGNFIKSYKYHSTID